MPHDGLGLAAHNPDQTPPPAASCLDWEGAVVWSTRKIGVLPSEKDRAGFQAVYTWGTM